MHALLDAIQATGVGLVWVLVVILCITGTMLSGISLSGTWLVLLAAIIAALVPDHPYPGFWTLGIFLVLSIGVEVLEAVAGAWGVTRRGGSKLAGLMALIGGLVGLVLGSFIPVPILGSLFGMMAGSFLLVYLVERRRHPEAHAAHVARGAVVARVLIILLKVIVTLGMSIFLIGGMVHATF